ncbi:MAG: hypothetical protein KDJ37_15435 [Hyphomicrobiaceae bacterium]|nr:hypothetical protein [Hyphomicrobiaceae bacterium]
MMRNDIPSAYTRRIQTSRREIAIALAISLAAIALTFAAFLSTGSSVEEALKPVAVQTPLNAR